MNAVGVAVTVFAQHRLQIGGGQAATAQVASVHFAIADEHHQRRVDEPAEGWNQAQSSEDCMGGQKTQQCSSRL